jgi:hypothetical protein
MALQRRFVNDCGGRFKTPLKETRGGGRTLAWLLWGDHVRVVQTSGGFSRIRGRASEGWIPSDCLGDEGLLELYIVDVGQGDGVLMRTPDDKWHVIDAGVENDAQMTKKGMPNFVRWKFIEDLGRTAVRLHNVILSHSDFDHYGGLIDLFQGRVQRPDRVFAVEVENFYHCGIGRFASVPKLGRTTEGTVAEPPFDEYGVDGRGTFITELLAGKSTFRSPARPFDETFARFARLVGTVPATVRRLSHVDEFLPGYGEADDVTIRVLGPIVETPDGSPGLRVLGSESVTRNGHSIVLRLEYGKARMLLTGDLNTASQRLLLSYHPLDAFAVDVAKGCHHGSDDIDLRFVRAMKARVTVISSGDNEDYAHPRPRVLGASARYGRESKAVNGEFLPPLLYSTELARSVRLAFAARVREANGTRPEIAAADAEIKAAGRAARFEPLEEVPISTDLIYGLINVRTDGDRVVCAYMKEQGKDFDVKAFKAGVEPAL